VLDQYENTWARMRPLLMASALAGAVAVAGCSSSSSGDSPVAREVATTQYGDVSGVEDESVLRWMGVPFARPPVGELRWRAPQAPESWTGTREATEQASECVQAQTNVRWQRSSTVVGSEDCLYLDIYRPNREGYRDERLPVYVWIHGGSNNFGTAKQYNGQALANRADAVVIFTQYRLGALGWLNHPAALADAEDDELSASGNFGTLDNIRALEWVRDNVAAFGGDPANVTVAGESAGAHNVMNLLVSPLAEGLFHKAIVQSAAMANVALSDVARSNADIDRAIMFHEDLDTVAEGTALREEMEADESLQAYLAALPASAFYSGYVASKEPSSLPAYGAYNDGVVLPETDWMTTLRSGEFHAVPVIIGANEHESKPFMPLFGALVKSMLAIPSGDHSWMDLIAVAHGEGELTVDDVLPTETDRAIYDATGYYGGQSWRAKYSDELAAEMAETNENVYAYHFRWGGEGSGPAPFDFIYGAGHAGEIPFFHGASQGLFGLPFTAENEHGRVELQYAMMDYVAQFIRTGKPNGTRTCDDERCLTTWSAWSASPAGSRVIELNADMHRAQIRMAPEVTLAQVITERNSEMASLPLSPAQAGTLNVFFGQTPWPAP
jgi:para-nitrobenzyl esterase